MAFTCTNLLTKRLIEYLCHCMNWHNFSAARVNIGSGQGAILPAIINQTTDVQHNPTVELHIKYLKKCLLAIRQSYSQESQVIDKIMPAVSIFWTLLLSSRSRLLQ